MTTMLASNMLYEDAESTGSFHSENLRSEAHGSETHGSETIDSASKVSNLPPAALSAAERQASAEPAPKLEPLADATAEDLVQLFKLLADETRLRILFYLMQQEELNVRTLCELLDQSQPAVSHHLALLRVAGMIECRRDGKHNFYHVVPRRCQQYLDTLFAASPQQKRRFRIEDSVLTYARDEQLGA